MSARDIAASYIRYMTEGLDADAWAADELSDLARDNPERAWHEILRINSLPIVGTEWREVVYATIGCGPLEALIVLHEARMLPVILDAAKADEVLQGELSAIYESSVSPRIWAAIQAITAQQPAARDRVKKRGA
jgi:hypothetical protein